MPNAATANDLLAHSLTASQNMLMRYTEDLTPPEYLHRPTPAANCAAWLLGHLAMTDRRLLSNTLKVSDLPPLPEGFDKRFSRDEGCPQAGDFGDVTILRDIFRQHRERLIAEARRLTDSADEPLPKGHPMFKTPREMVNFMALHTAMHAGQITIIRRSLGRPPIV
jgi:hypothetical protein